MLTFGVFLGEHPLLLRRIRVFCLFIDTDAGSDVNDAILQAEPLMASVGTCNQKAHTLLSLL